MTNPSGYIRNPSPARYSPAPITNLSGYLRSATVTVIPSAPTGLSATSTNNTVTLTFTSDMALQGQSIQASNWIITSTNGVAVTVNTVTVGSLGTNQITLTTTNQTTGAAYTVTIPSGLIGLNGLFYTLPNILTFTGSGLSPTILYTKADDGYSIEIGYSDPMDPLSTLNINNYAINNNLIVTNITQLTSKVFLLTTSRQVTGTTYTVTVSNGPTGVKSIYLNQIS